MRKQTQGGNLYFFTNYWWLYTIHLGVFFFKLSCRPLITLKGLKQWWRTSMSTPSKSWDLTKMEHLPLESLISFVSSIVSSGNSRSLTPHSKMALLNGRTVLWWRWHAACCYIEKFLLIYGEKLSRHGPWSMAEQIAITPWPVAKHMNTHLTRDIVRQKKKLWLSSQLNRYAKIT